MSTVDKSIYLDVNFWKSKRVFLTGHTGFKGSWMVKLLNMLGAKIYGYALAPNTTPNMFTELNLEELCETNTIADIRDIQTLKKCIFDAEPDILIHMAAQPIVSVGYVEPAETFDVNVMGTVNFLEACRQLDNATVLVISSDKCYRNNESGYAFKESDPLGGADPYSASKAGTEIVVQSWLKSFFDGTQNNVLVSSARAGNVIGGGDWSVNRLIPDAARAFAASDPVIIRSPDAVRPWQHVIEPVVGYLRLIEKLSSNRGFSRAWNFGPDTKTGDTVGAVIDLAVQEWRKQEETLGGTATASFELEKTENVLFSESKLLSLDCSDAFEKLNWNPILTTEGAVRWSMEWYYNFYKLKDECIVDLTERQIIKYHQAQV